MAEHAIYPMSADVTDGKPNEGADKGGQDVSTVVCAVSKLERCCRRCILLAVKLSEELKRQNMLKACEQVSTKRIKPVICGS